MTVGKSHTEAGSAAFAGSTKQDFGTKNTSSFPPADTTTGKTVQEEMGITGGNDFSLRGGTKAEYKGEESTIPNPESAAEGEPLSTAGRSGDKIKDSVKGHDVAGMKIGALTDEQKAYHETDPKRAAVPPPDRGAF